MRTGPGPHSGMAERVLRETGADAIIMILVHGESIDNRSAYRTSIECASKEALFLLEVPELLERIRESFLGEPDDKDDTPTNPDDNTVN